MARGDNLAQVRPKGRTTKNKATKDLKEMISGALDDAGGRQYLAQQAIDNPPAFMQLVGKIIPRDLNVDVAATIVMQVVTGVPDGES